MLDFTTASAKRDRCENGSNNEHTLETLHLYAP
jgi:hypothetical protein